MMNLKKKIFLISGTLVFLFLGWLWLFGSSLRPQPPLETKFVIEKTPIPSAPPLAEATAVPLAQPGNKVLLKGTKVVAQTFNNCGPANLSMILSYYGINKSQEELSQQIRPWQHPKGNNDDKTVFYDEFVEAVEKFGLNALVRPAGSLEILKMFTANGVPVVLKTRLKPNEDSAHYRIIRGFDENAKVLIIDDSYFGGNRRVPYFEFMETWQPFGYHYLPVYPAEKEPVVKAILGQSLEEKFAWNQALDRAGKESQLDPESIIPRFNLSVAYYHLGEYEKSVAEFERIESRLTKRALWYQIEPILAYRELKNYDRVFALSNQLFGNGNRAFSELYQLRGEIYLEKGNKEAARKEFELALKYHQGFRPAIDALSKL